MKKEKNENEKIEIKDLTKESINNIMDYYNLLNNDKSHFKSNDDICTPMRCVEKMINYIPASFWKSNIKVLDPCCGNGNFGAYCKTKTNIDNIYFNELNEIRFNNCKKILNPPHILNGDFFEINKVWNFKWDLIIANPPYSGGGNKNQSLSNVFIEKSIDLLEDNGYLCFVVPNNWMTYNNNNTTLQKLLNNGSFLVIDYDVKKHFPGVGSSFVIFLWQKTKMDNLTLVVNNYLKNDIQKDVKIPNTLKCIPLYLSNDIISICQKVLSNDRNDFNYRCDLHNFTQKEKLSDTQNEIFQYETIHTARKTRYAKIKQDIYDKWTIVIPLSTYYIPFIKNKINVTQSVGYISFNTKDEADKYLKKITKNYFKLIIHLTRYGNFNNIMILKHLKFGKRISFTESEKKVIDEMCSLIKY